MRPKSLVKVCSVCGKYKRIKQGSACGPCQLLVLTGDFPLVQDPRDKSFRYARPEISYDELMGTRTTTWAPKYVKTGTLGKVISPLTIRETEIKRRQETVLAQNSYRPSRGLALLIRVDQMGHYFMLASWLAVVVFILV